MHYYNDVAITKMWVYIYISMYNTCIALQWGTHQSVKWIYWFTQPKNTKRTEHLLILICEIVHKVVVSTDRLYYIK